MLRDIIAKTLHILPKEYSMPSMLIGGNVYYLISPDKKVVYRTEKLEDYSEIINKLKVEN